MDTAKQLRKLPSIDRVLKTAAAGRLKARFLPRLVDAEVRALVEDLRGTMKEGGDPGDLAPEAVAERAGARLSARLAPGIVRCVNATGVILHTGLGRAAFAPKVIEALDRELQGYCVVSVDRQEGQRVRRETAAARMLTALTGAEAATVVNNNAAATLIALNTLAAGREVVISRGQLVEIGGSFRMPDVFKAAGVVLKEVGTTNRTHRRDYADAIGPSTGLLLRVHPSNFRTVGFTAEVPLGELIELGRAANVPVMDDLGAGALVPIEPEPEIGESLALGADLVTCSGDKLIGGPQCGILLGKLEWIDRVRKNPLFRALRVDKMTLCALEATLGLFLAPGGPGDAHPTFRMLHMGAPDLKRRASALRARLKKEAPRLATEVRPGFSEVGSGSLPGGSLPTTLVSIRHPTLSAAALARMLRFGDPPVYARIVDDLVCIDPRTLLPGDDRLLVRALKEVS
ncbi:MAG TPA: L-seryl-tRNA(Sec) selenium transferase [Planctomycetota bacterium]|nr:L-seryl-tRNA(Sec) selenium transferase [Planctomycetota bacterium]